jgi:hypothetical protein
MEKCPSAENLIDQDAIDEERRSYILRMLDSSENGRLNAGMIQVGLQRMGMVAPRHTVLADLAWLEQTRLLSVSDLPVGIKLAILRQLGSDVAKGEASIPGVAKLKPEA